MQGIVMGNIIFTSTQLCQSQACSTRQQETHNYEILTVLCECLADRAEFNGTKKNVMHVQTA